LSARLQIGGKAPERDVLAQSGMTLSETPGVAGISRIAP
jgi:hypothetical protein